MKVSNAAPTKAANSYLIVRDKLLKLIGEADRLMAEFPEEMAKRKRMLEAELAALARTAERAAMSDSEFGAELVGTSRAILDDARAWAAERPGLPGFTADLLTKDGVAKARADCGAQFRAAVNKLDRALAGKDGPAVVLALIELGHAGRNQEIMTRFVDAAKSSRLAATYAARAGQREGGSHGKVTPEMAQHMRAYYAEHGSIKKTAETFGVSRDTVRRHVTPVTARRRGRRTGGGDK